MSSTNSSPVRATSQEQNFLPLTAPIVSNKLLQNRPLTFFLLLAPATSASYPRAPNGRDRASSIPTSPDAAGPPSRRSSSISSVSGPRILKLGPVHWGEHPGDNKDDFHTIG